MQQQLITDPLTGVYNRLALKNVFETLEDSSDNYFFAMLDLDSFKALNDTLGHAKGDECLEEIGRILRKYSTADIMPFRFGGDEFCILFRNMTHDEVTTLCDAIRKEYASMSLGKLSTALTISIGIAPYEQGAPVEDLLHNADKALYRAKSQKNSISFEG